MKKNMNHFVYERAQYPAIKMVNGTYATVLFMLPNKKLLIDIIGSNDYNDFELYCISDTVSHYVYKHNLHLKKYICYISIKSDCTDTGKRNDKAIVSINNLDGHHYCNLDVSEIFNHFLNDPYFINSKIKPFNFI